MSQSFDKHKIRHRSEAGEDQYAGIPCFATAELHPIVANKVAQFADRFAPKPLVLDLGAGRGAFSKRMIDAGYQVEAIELEDAPWDVPEVPVKWVDFCAISLPGELLGRYDIIVSIEVIEHVPDPLAFLTNIGRALKPNGVAIVTTPSPTNVGGLALLSWLGEYPLFSYENYWGTGHRNILPDFLLRAFAESAGLDVREMIYVCKGKWPIKLWLSLVPIFPAVLWHRIRFPKRWNQLHNLLVAEKPESQ